MWGVRAMITNEIRALQPSAVLEDFLCQRKSRLSSLPSYHRTSLPCAREQPFAARCPFGGEPRYSCRAVFPQAEGLVLDADIPPVHPLRLSSPLSAVCVLIALCRMLLSSG